MLKDIIYVHRNKSYLSTQLIYEENKKNYRAGRNHQSQPSNQRRADDILTVLSSLIVFY